MGQARDRGSFKERKAQAIATGRIKGKKDRFSMIDMYGIMAGMFMGVSAPNGKFKKFLRK